MICNECGKHIKGEPELCPYCEAPLTGQVSLSAINEVHEKKRKPRKRKLSRQELILRISLIATAVLAVIAILLGVVYLYVKNLINNNANIDDKFSSSEQEELDINAALPTKDILNIALFGLDERGETGELYDEAGHAKSFHSDAIIILTIDRRNSDAPTVKMTSLGRDSLVYVEGYKSKDSMTKLTHAFDYGYRLAKNADLNDNGQKDLTEEDYKREGAKVAIKTINKNFNMNITEYMYVNFVEFMDIIDFIGGVTIDVEKRELNELNKHVRSMEKECGKEIDTVTNAGVQTLSGGQALAYARIRKIDSDLKRADRQRDVLRAVFDKVKSEQLTKLPGIAAKMLNMCHTTLTADELVEMGTWAVSNPPAMVNFTLPNDDCNPWGGTHDSYGWVWIYDLPYATNLLHTFIYDKEVEAEPSNPTQYPVNNTTAKNTTSATVAESTTTTAAPTIVGTTTTAPVIIQNTTTTTVMTTTTVITTTTTNATDKYPHLWTTTEPTTAPTDPTEAPTDPTEAPTDPTAAPTDPTEAPTDPTEAPTDPTEAPTDPTEAPTDPTEAPTDPTEAPTDPTEAPTDPTEAPTDPTEAPTTATTQNPLQIQVTNVVMP